MEENSDYFELENIRTRRKNRLEKINGDFRQHPLPPIEKIIRMEDNAKLKEFSNIFYLFMRDRDDFSQFSFLMTSLGRGWADKMKMPREFSDMKDSEFIDYLFENEDRIQERIDIFREYCGKEGGQKQIVASANNLARIPFGIAAKDKIIGIYDKVRSKERVSYPSGFFHPDNPRIPKVLTRYLVDEVEGVPHDRLGLETLDRDFFEKNCLSGMLHQYFLGSSKKALKHAYTSDEFPELYDSANYELSDVLREVFIKLGS